MSATILVDSLFPPSLGEAKGLSVACVNVGKQASVTLVGGTCCSENPSQDVSYFQYLFVFFVGTYGEVCCTFSCSSSSVS